MRNETSVDCKMAVREEREQFGCKKRENFRETNKSEMDNKWVTRPALFQYRLSDAAHTMEQFSFHKLFHLFYLVSPA